MNLPTPCADYYKSFETLNLENYIAQQSTAAPPTELTKVRADYYKSFETLNLEDYIAQISTATPPSELTNTFVPESPSCFSGPALSPPTSPKKAPLPNQAKTSYGYRVQQTSATDRHLSQQPTAPSAQQPVLGISKKAQGPQQPPIAQQQLQAPVSASVTSAAPLPSIPSTTPKPDYAQIVSCTPPTPSKKAPLPIQTKAFFHYRANQSLAQQSTHLQPPILFIL